MISDPLLIENGANDVLAPRIVSPNQNTGRFRGELEGYTYLFEFIQNGNANRSRHVARFVAQQPANALGVIPSVTFTITMDEPADGSITNTNMLFYWNTVIKGTLTDEVVMKMLNGEV